LWLTALDLAGTIRWQTEVGPHAPSHGSGPSPVIYQSLVLVNGDSPDVGFVAAVHRRTGQVVWRKRRPGKGSFASPLVAELTGRPQLILTGNNMVTSFDPRTGEVHWTCAGPSEATGNTVTAGDGVVYACGGFPERRLLAIRADGAGDVTSTHVLWEWGRKTEIPYCTSMLLHRGLLYVVSDDGIASCFEAGTGRQCWRERLGGVFWSSPLLAGDLIYAVNQRGTAFVFKARPEKFTRVGRNRLDGGVNASPVMVNNRLYLRTATSLYCIGAPG
jgi:outer membrane protein assembly factor BamB